MTIYYSYFINTCQTNVFLHVQFCIYIINLIHDFQTYWLGFDWNLFCRKRRGTKITREFPWKTGKRGRWLTGLLNKTGDKIQWAKVRQWPVYDIIDYVQELTEFKEDQQRTYKSQPHQNWNDNDLIIGRWYVQNMNK